MARKLRPTMLNMAPPDGRRRTQKPTDEEVVALVLAMTGEMHEARKALNEAERIRQAFLRDPRFRQEMVDGARAYHRNRLGKFLDAPVRRGK